MDPIIQTERLKLTLLRSGEEGSPEFMWMHQLRTDSEATKWSRWGPSKTIEDTLKFNKAILPPPQGEGHEAQYRASYAVHRTSRSQESKFIGLITVRPEDEVTAQEKLEIAQAQKLQVVDASKSSTLIVALGYLFLPSSWGQGLATEAVRAVLHAYQGAKSFWDPYTQVYLRALVDPGNAESIRVLEKVGLEKRGTYEWEGEQIWLAGGWRECSEFVYGTYLAE